MKIYQSKQLVGELPYLKRGKENTPILFRWGINIDVREPDDVLVEPVWMPLVATYRFTGAILVAVWNRWAFILDRRFPFIHRAARQEPILEEE